MGIVSGACRGVDPLSSAFLQLWSIRVCTCPLHLFNDLVLVRRCDVKAYPADPRSKTIKLSDAAVRRSLRSVRDSVVWSSCPLPCSAPSALFRDASDVVFAGYARTCADTIMWASFVHALRGSGARVIARLWSTRNWIRFLVCSGLSSKVVATWFAGR